MTSRMDMAEEGVDLNMIITQKMGDDPKPYTPFISQIAVERAIIEVSQEADGTADKGAKSKPISKDRRTALLQRYKLSSVARASDIDWQLLTKTSNGLTGPLIEKVINEA